MIQNFAFIPTQQIGDFYTHDYSHLCLSTLQSIKSLKMLYNRVYNAMRANHKLKTRLFQSKQAKTLSALNPNQLMNLPILLDPRAYVAKK
jgi:hypothetical protein